MPRKKQPQKFKYTVRKNGELYVRFPVDGLKSRVWRKCETETQEEVNRVIEVIKKDFSRDKEFAETPTRCDKFFDFWLSFVKSSISERTYANRETFIRLYLKPALGIWNIADVRPIQFQMIYAAMTEKGLSPVTVRKAHAIASSIFKEALNLDLIAKNPVVRVKPPKLTETGKIKTLQPSQIKSFLRECETATNGIIFEFALETGMRPQEYLALRWSDVDLKNRTASVSRALVASKSGGGWYFKEPKTRKSRRIVPLSEKLCEKLETYRENQKTKLAEIRARLKKRYKPSREFRRVHHKKLIESEKELNLVFPSDDFTPLAPSNLNRRYFKPIAEKLGVDKSFTLYNLRHTSISLLLLAGVNVKVISERAGHSDIRLTLQTYSQVLDGEQSKATDSLSKILYD